MSSLTDGQEKLLSLLPIPSSLLSIFGSISIIRIACRSRQTKKWTPYTRLLIAISSCDIIYSITMGISGFMLPQDTSDFVWAVGNDGTCTALGFFSQFFVCVLSYNAALSFYFLLSARFQIKNDIIARRYEPWMHVISLGYPLSIGFVGLVLGVYHENDFGQGCWVNDYPENCGFGPGQSGEACQTDLMGWIFGGAITVISFLCVVVNNLIILKYVRNQTMMKQKPTTCTAAATTTTSTSSSSRTRRSTRTTTISQASVPLSSIGSCSEEFSVQRESNDDVEATTAIHTEGTDESSGSEHGKKDGTSSEHYDDDEEMGIGCSPSSSSHQGKEQHQETKKIRKDQLKRLKLVASQAFLYVAAFILCTSWTALLQGLQSGAKMQGGNEYNAMELEVALYPILVLQAIFLPLQGLLNFLVYIRPKYLKYKNEYPNLSSIALLQHIVNGKSLPSSPPPPLPPSPQYDDDAGLRRKVAGDVKKDNNEDAKAPRNPHAAGKTKSKITDDTSHMPADALATSERSSKKWETGGVKESPLVPIPQRLSSNNNNTVSSVTVSQGDFDEESIFKNNKWDGHQVGGGSSESMPPLPSSAKRCFDDGTVTACNSRRLVAGGNGALHTVSSVTLPESEFDQEQESISQNNKWEDQGCSRSSERLPSLPSSRAGLRNGSDLHMMSSVTLPESEFDDGEESASLHNTGKWEHQGGRGVGTYESNALPPIARRLDGQHQFNINTVSSVTLAESEFDDEESTSQNNKWRDLQGDGSSADNALHPPIIKRLNDDHASGFCAREANECSGGGKKSTISTTTKWEAGGSTQMPPSLPKTHKKSCMTRFAQDSSLEMIAESEITLPSDFEDSNGSLVVNDADSNCSQESKQDTVPTSSFTRTSRSSKTKRVHFKGGEKEPKSNNNDDQQDPPKRKTTRRWSATDCPSGYGQKFSNGQLVVERQDDNGGGGDLPLIDHSGNILTNIGHPTATKELTMMSIDSPIFVPKRKMSPPPSPSHERKVHHDS